MAARASAGGVTPPPSSRRERKVRAVKRLRFELRERKRAEAAAWDARGGAPPRPAPAKLAWEVGVTAAVVYGHGGAALPLRRLELAWNRLFPGGRLFGVWAERLGYARTDDLVALAFAETVVVERPPGPGQGAAVVRPSEAFEAEAARVVGEWPHKGRCAVALRTLENAPGKEVFRMRNFLNTMRARELGPGAGPDRYGDVEELAGPTS